MAKFDSKLDVFHEHPTTNLERVHGMTVRLGDPVKEFLQFDNFAFAVLNSVHLKICFSIKLALVSEYIWLFKKIFKFLHFISKHARIFAC